MIDDVGLTPFEMVVIVLAGYRLARLIVWDSLVGTHPESGTRLGEAIDQWAYNADGSDREGRFWRSKMADLITCPMCLSMWLSIGLWGVWVNTRFMTFWHNIVVVLAISGAICLLAQLDHVMQRSGQRR